ncbi:NADH-quinone oxidoreductase subunit J [Rhodococcus sp. X156]|uniref:NADH-quinone oxidoreductase subunit J n=1 Tax=Rhodococcus sp. X156 TaxID=2499145 RepID=UPI001F49EC47|nr:NADH-quinone oxidoreductase subunit J [Rhodococcus sp. X156]
MGGTAMTTTLLAQGASGVSTGEAVVFWILGPLALAGGLGMVLARNAVHSALFLAMSMLSLGVLYLVQQAPFLGFVQIIVYTGAIMMLFLFVLMLVGRDASDSVVEVLRGHRLAGIGLGLGFAVLVVAALARALTDVHATGLTAANDADGGNVGQIGRLLFTDYLFPFELTSALLITAALGAMVLAYVGRGAQDKSSQRERVVARLRGDRISPLPGPGVFATTSSVATPALLPDGSVAPESISAIIEATATERLTRDLAQVRSRHDSRDPHQLTGDGTREEEQ